MTKTQFQPIQSPVYPSVFCYSVSQSSDNQGHLLQLFQISAACPGSAPLPPPSRTVHLIHDASQSDSWTVSSTFFLCGGVAALLYPPLKWAKGWARHPSEKACICDLFLSVITEKLVTIRDWVKSCPHVKQFICHTSVCLLTVGH